MKIKFLMAIAIAVVTSLTISAQPQRMRQFAGSDLDVQIMHRNEQISKPAGNLDEKQREELQKIRTEQMKENTRFRNQLKEKRAKLETLQTADKPDMKEINKVIDEIATVQAQEMKSQAANRQKIRALLTEEQRVRFDAMGGANRENLRSGAGNQRFGRGNTRQGMGNFRSETETFRPGMRNIRPDFRSDRITLPKGDGFRRQRPERQEISDKK